MHGGLPNTYNPDAQSLPGAPYVTPMSEQQILQAALDLHEYEQAAIKEESVDKAVLMLDRSMDDVFSFFERLAHQARERGLRPQRREQ